MLCTVYLQRNNLKMQLRANMGVTAKIAICVYLNCDCKEERDAFPVENVNDALVW
jgi:hypothetical protein